MVSVRETFCKMKVTELDQIVRMFELKVPCRKKDNIIDIIYEYMKNNINNIFREFIVYEELNLLRKICDNNFKILCKDVELDSDNVHSLLCIGIIYIEKTNIIIPKEFQNLIKSCLDDKYIIEFSKKREDIISIVQNLLELYGVFHLELLEDYIIDKIGRGYRVHKIIEFIRKYNMRNNFYYEDEDCFYYNLKITDRPSMKMKIIEINLRYKYFHESEMTDIINRESHYEKDIKIILNRIYKNLKASKQIIKVIKFMIIEGRTSEEIGGFIKEKVKRLSEFGFRSIVKSVDNMRKHYVIWGFKGYSLEEIDKKIMA
ncbi:hypothetical protein [Clostridium butyricum]